MNWKKTYNYFFQICRTCAEISGSGLSNHADKSFGYCSRSNCLWWVWGPLTLSYGNLTKFFFCGCFRCCDRQDLPPLAGPWGRWRHQLSGLRQHLDQQALASKSTYWICVPSKFVSWWTASCKSLSLAFLWGYSLIEKCHGEKIFP